MTTTNGLIAVDHSSPKEIAIIGEAMEDVWISGTLSTCQDSCPCFQESSRLSTPGGAAGAARQLAHWHSRAHLIAPLPWRRVEASCRLPVGWDQVETQCCFGTTEVPVKHRYLVDGKIVLRTDQHDDYMMGESVDVDGWRQDALRALRSCNWGAVLISDYDKGFLSKPTIQEIITHCKTYNIPVVADAKRGWLVYDGAVLKYNAAYGQKHDLRLFDQRVQTNGAERPFVNGAVCPDPQDPVQCRNHVGAGDCFAAHLTLALAHGWPLSEAAAIAHAAGRVYVQHTNGRPPWPHEIAKDVDPLGGKVLRGSPSSAVLAALRESISGRVVFANGVFRIPCPWHSRLLSWARKQGDALVVGINDEASAARLRPGQLVLSLEDRLDMLAAQEAVDWIIPYAEDTPETVMQAIRPDILVKGDEYRDQEIPGASLAGEVKLFPMGATPLHVSDLLRGKVRV